MRKVILDTDIGTDVDDALALALALKSNDLQLEAVTTVHGDVDLRAKIALKMLRLAGVKDVPVAKGIKKPLLRERKVHWSGHEGEGFLTPADKGLKPDSRHAIDLIISKVLSMKGEISLITVGPLTNIAVAIIKQPDIVKNIRELFIMGGVTPPHLLYSFSMPKVQEDRFMPFKEYNIFCDPEAARVVFNSGLPITMVPLNVTSRITVNREELKEISSVATPFTEAIVSMVEHYLKLHHRDYTMLHDPLTVAVAIDDSIIKKIEARVLIETRGEETTGMTVTSTWPKLEKNARVCIDVDVEKFKTLFMKNILAL